MRRVYVHKQSGIGESEENTNEVDLGAVREATEKETPKEDRERKKGGNTLELYGGELKETDPDDITQVAPKGETTKKGEDTREGNFGEEGTHTEIDRNAVRALEERVLGRANSIENVESLEREEDKPEPRPVQITDTLETFPVQANPRQELLKGKIIALPPGHRLTGKYIYKGGLSPIESQEFDLVSRINHNTRHPAYSPFSRKTNDAEGLLAIAYTNARGDDLENKDILSMNHFRNLREKIKRDNERVGMDLSMLIPLSERKNTMTSVGTTPQIYLYVQKEEGKDIPRIWIFDSAAEGCSVKIPLKKFKSPEAIFASSIFVSTRGNKTEAVKELRELFLKDMEPNDDCYDWQNISHLLAEYKRTKRKAKNGKKYGFSFDAFLANYFVIGKMLDPFFEGMNDMAEAEKWKPQILRKYREYLQTEYGSRMDNCEAVIHTRMNSSFFEDSGLLYTPRKTDLRLDHLPLGTLEEEWEATIGFGGRLNPAYVEKGAEKEYSCELKIKHEFDK